ncbi:collagen alpha-1(XXVIII) chain-like isoform X1 [Octopus sinensis]|uniref:Collagen alpha-1(XXVIII) chain-like isoform X1 n=1 Tax=Octopus sinensis TaxID=2607531 RepID=A0A6P7S8P3_9MOLL|nr:collagen alpha-1(XXVIII) chain-like isoform X1 [Octopus sinensis]
MKLTVTLFALLYLHLIIVKAFPKTQCVGKETDILFVLDSSSSIWPKDYERLLKFIQEFVDSFEVGMNKMRMGVITYSKKAHLEFPIGQYVTKEKLQKAISKIRYRSGWTNTAAALKLVKEQFQSLVKSNATLVTIVITDGNSRSHRKTKAEAANLHRLGIKVYAIGIGKKYHIKELKVIASDPDNGVYRFFNYKSLESIGKNFFIKSCRVGEPEVPGNIVSKTTPVVLEKTTKSPVLKVNDTSTTEVSPSTTTTVSYITVPTPVTTISISETTTTSNYKNETSPQDKPGKGRPEILPKTEATVILFGYDMVSLGYNRTAKISTFISKLLPYMTYQYFGVTNYAYCPSGFSIPLTSVTNFTRQLVQENNFPTLVDIVKKMRNLIYTHTVLKEHSGTPTAVLFVDSEMTNISDSLLEETRKLKGVRTRLFVVSIGSGQTNHTRDFHFLSSQPHENYTYYVSNYKQLVQLADDKPQIFKDMCNHNFTTEIFNTTSQRPDLS